MRNYGLVLLLFAVFVAPLSAVQASQVLVVLAQDQSKNVEERSIVDRVMMTTVRNATYGKYTSTVFLIDELANKRSFLRVVSQAAREGHDVDVLLLTPITDDRIVLRDGNLDADELVQVLMRLRELPTGGVRFVYTNGGPALTRAWRELGAKAVLAGQSRFSSDTIPFFFPRFIKMWGQGAPITRAAASAIDLSNRFVSSFSPFVDATIQHENNGIITAAPVLDGSDINIFGKGSTERAALNDVAWPGVLQAPVIYPHTELGQGVLESLASLVAGRFSLRSDFVPGISELVSSVGAPTWEYLSDIFPGRGPNELIFPGADVRVILGKVLPGIDKYLELLIENLETVVVTRNNGRLSADVWLSDPKGIRFDLRKEGQSKTGQAYAVKIRQHMHLDLFARRDSITVDSIAGISVLVKLPVVPDGVAPKRLVLDTASEKLTISAQAIRGVVEVVATADVRHRKFTGVDWLATMLKNAPLLIGLLLFSPI